MTDKVPPEITPEVLAQNPGLAIAISIFTTLLFVFLAGTLTTWVFLAIKTRRGEAWLQIETWSPRVWGLLDIVVLAILAVSCQVVFASTGARLLGLDVAQAAENGMPLTLTTIANLGNVAATVLGVAWIMLRFNVGASHVGFQFRQFPRQVKIAVVAALAALPLVYLMMAAVSQSFESDYEHPLLEELKANASLGGYLMGFVTAVLVAPFAEEFMFRVILQGWLQSLPSGSLTTAIFGAQAHPIGQSPIAAPSEPSAIPLADLEPAEASDSSNEYESSGEPTSTAGIPPIWPSVATGILFGLAHWGYGLSFIPLIVLGIILGLLYRATQSIWPSVIVHMILNGSSMARARAWLINREGCWKMTLLADRH